MGKSCSKLFKSLIFIFIKFKFTFQVRWLIYKKHCDNRPDMTIRPEVYQREFIKEYIADHPGTFEKISLVDLHGGFNK